MRTRFKFVVFCFVGACAFFIDLLIFNFFYWLGLGFIISITLGWLISMIFNFTTNRNLTFSARGSSVKSQLPWWLLVYFVAFLARAVIGKGVLFWLGDEGTLSANIAFFAGLCVSVPTSFIGSLWVFNKRPYRR